jgi:phosphoribosylformimino-5-aminoimidazole carboxamide ribonucleotide (ProFAR) isomerase
MPPPKFKVIRHTVALSLLVEKTQNKLLTVSQFLDAFSAGINLGGGIRLAETALKKSFTSREREVKYHLSCCDMNVVHGGYCVSCSHILST